MSVMTEFDVANETHWHNFAHQWLIRSDTTYLNHGSFGPPPQPVKQRKRQWLDTLDSQPMDFYTRQLEPALLSVRKKLAEFLKTHESNLVFVENATFGMNVVADSFPLGENQTVLINDHEYGAVHRIWQRKCERSNAHLNVVQLPQNFDSPEQIVDCITAALTENTKLVVISHITSATAIIMPIREIIAAVKKAGVNVLVDGPHAPAQLDLNIDQLGCDFYTASCHKWLSAGLGSGFLYVTPAWQQHVEPQLKSWGRLLPAIPQSWDEEFIWSGTRDPSAYLSIADAIEFLDQEIGIPVFQQRSQYLASQAEEMLCSEFGTSPIAKRDQGFYASMAHVPLPENRDFGQLQQKLWEEYRIEVPVIHFNEKWYIRVSCHLYNNIKHLESLRFAIRKLLL